MVVNKQGMKMAFIFMLISMYDIPTLAQSSVSVAILDPSITKNSSSNIHALNIGDQVPDVTLEIENYHSKKAKLSDFQGKFLILDFWATWCKACIKKLPELNSLQLEFKDQDLQVLLVNSNGTGDKSDQVSFFLKRQISRNTKNFILPSVVNDSVLCRLFPHRSVPHYVLINEDGIVQAITSSDQVTEENIHSFVEGKPLNLTLKKEDLEFDRKKPLFENGNGGTYDDCIFRSFLTGHLEGLPVTDGYNRNEKNEVIRFYAINRSILALYRIAYSDLFIKYSKRIILQTKDPSKYEFNITRSWNEWKYDNSYSYELIVPPSTIRQIRLFMQDDLKKYFGLKVYIEKRKVRHLVSKSTNCNFELPLSVVNQSNYAGKISIHLSNSFTKFNFEFFKSVLSASGFDVTEVEREIDFLIIAE